MIEILVNKIKNDTTQYLSSTYLDLDSKTNLYRFEPVKICTCLCSLFNINSALTRVTVDIIACNVTCLRAGHP